MNGPDTDFSICICTFKRPALLKQLLNIIHQELEMPGPTEVVVVDNDQNESARGCVDVYASASPSVRYFVEPEQNIALARNRAVSEARGSWIAMIDDDELPDPKWLVNLFGCARDLDADAVFGPVEAMYSNECPRWVIEGRFFEKEGFATGTRVLTGQTRTSNVLLKRDLMSAREGPFDPAFGLSGGEDSLLFDGLLLEGKRFFWCDNAVVKEHVPAGRATWRWLLKRAFRGGQTSARIFLRGYDIRPPSTSTKGLYLCRTLIKLLVATVLSIAFLPFGKVRSFQWFRSIAIQIGKASAFTPFVYQAYEDSS